MSMSKQPLFDLSNIGLAGSVPTFDLQSLSDEACSYLVNRNPNYVFDNTDVMRLIVYAWIREFRRPEGRHRKGVYVSGPTGSGKSSVIEEFFAAIGVPLVRTTWNPKREGEEMLSRRSLDDGKLVDVDQAIAIAARLGLPVKIDEIDLADPAELVALNDVIEKGLITLPNGTVIHAERGFVVFATANTAGVEDETGTYHGTRSLNASTLRRFFTVEMGYPDEETETKFLAKSLPNYPTGLIESAAKTVTMIRGAAAGTLDGKRLTFPISRPETIDWLEMMAAFGKITFKDTTPAQYAMNACFAARLPAADREVVKELVQTVFSS
jgi:cobaltochelatase CobS